MLHWDTDGYRILNFRNFRIRIGYGYAKIFSNMDQELKNQYLPRSEFTHDLLKEMTTQTPATAKSEK